MIEDQYQNPFAQIRAFEWDEQKRKLNFLRHGIDFVDATQVIDGPFVARRSDRYGENRYMVFGFLDDREIVVICTIRNENCRLISARRARLDERKKYHNRLSP